MSKRASFSAGQKGKEVLTFYQMCSFFFLLISADFTF